MELLATVSSEQTDVHYCLGDFNVFNRIMGSLIQCFIVKHKKIWGLLLGLSFLSKAVVVSPSTVDYSECRSLLEL